jgi:hypothetical protein
MKPLMALLAIEILVVVSIYLLIVGAIGVYNGEPLGFVLFAFGLTSTTLLVQSYKKDTQ